MAEVLGEIVARFIAQIVLEIFMFRICRFIGWGVLKIVTLGMCPQGMWTNQKEDGRVSWFGLAIVVCAFILVILYIT